MESRKLSKGELKGALIVMGLMILLIISAVLLIASYDPWENSPSPKVQESPLEIAVKNLKDRVDKLEKQVGVN